MILRKQSAYVFQTIMQTKEEEEQGEEQEKKQSWKRRGGEEADHLRGRERLWKFFTFISSLKTKSKLKCQKSGNISILPKSKRN